MVTKQTKIGPKIKLQILHTKRIEDLLPSCCI